MRLQGSVLGIQADCQALTLGTWRDVHREAAWWLPAVGHDLLWRVGKQSRDVTGL